MKSKIFLYLFIFSSLIALYQFVSANNMIVDKNAKIEMYKAKAEAAKIENEDLKIKVSDLQYFALDNNEEALTYLDEYALEFPSSYIADKLIETNLQKGNNPLVPYEGMEGEFKINKIKVLNHKWIIADFSDGTYWGELFLGYRITENGGVDFTLLNHLLYSK